MLDENWTIIREYAIYSELVSQNSQNLEEDTVFADKQQWMAHLPFRFFNLIEKANVVMAQMLFYENVVPVSSERHKNLSIERVDFEFAANVNSVPLTAVEVPLAAREYTIVFAGGDEAVTPVVVLGIEGTKNQYLGVYT